ncbi:MAG TPA: hypothetical protein VHP11_12935 [Tepidisphaeraceae bacterium]|nr:hypothetical protein [Tepidisphaeraceae bacterium]
MLRTIGFAVFLPRPDGRLRKWGSPEFAAYQFQMGDAFAAFFAEPSEGQSRQKKKGSVLACFSGGIAPARSWNRAAPEFRLPLSDTRQGVRKAALASLDALKGLPMPKLSDAARGLMQRR